MRIALGLIRTSFALWFCLGVQVHLSLDNAAYAAHAAEGHRVAASGSPHESIHCACCVVSSSHRHHGHHIKHDHEVNAVAAKSSPRSLQLVVAAVLPILAIETLHQAEPPALDLTPAQISPLYLATNLVPRAPPAA